MGWDLLWKDPDQKVLSAKTKGCFHAELRVPSGGNSSAWGWRCHGALCSSPPPQPVRRLQCRRRQHFGHIWGCKPTAVRLGASGAPHVRSMWKNTQNVWSFVSETSLFVVFVIRRRQKWCNKDMTRDLERETTHAQEIYCDAKWRRAEITSCDCDAVWRCALTQQNSGYALRWPGGSWRWSAASIRSSPSVDAPRTSPLQWWAISPTIPPSPPQSIGF